MQGAIGAGAVAAAAPLLNDLQHNVVDKLKAAGANENVARAAAQVVATTAVAAVGAATTGGSAQGAAVAVGVDANNRQLHPDETKWIKQNAKRYAQQKGVSETQAESELAQQAYRQVQAGAAGDWDPSASAFLSHARGMLAADTNCPSCGPGYMFQATAEQKANPNMYASTLSQTVNFYAKNGIQIPSGQQVAAGAQRDSVIRDAAKTGTLLAPVAAASTVIAGLGPALATWVLANPVAATNTGIITADVAAQITSGAVTPTTVAEGLAAKAGQTGIKNTLGKADALLPDVDFAGRGVVRADLTDHLVNPMISGKQISGGHALNNFNTALNDAGGTVLSKVEKGPGIYEIQYRLPNASKPATKTVYDETMYPNMENMAGTAAAKALLQYHVDGKVSQTVIVDNVKFTVPIKVQNGEPYVPTAFPTGVSK